MVTVERETQAAAPAPGSVPPARWWVWVMALPVAVVVAWAVQRWTATMPFGSDNDEYRLVAGELVASGRPVVAGVEGSKYPLGYPLVLAGLDAVGLPVTRAALALNLTLVVTLAAVVAGTARTLGRRVAAVPGALYAVGGAGIWGSVFVTMPDLAFVVVTAAVLWKVGSLRGARDVWVVVALVVVATMVKSVGLLVAVAASVAVAAGAGRVRHLAWAPLAAAALTTVATALFVAPYPEHTTGYARTFLLVDPTDAAAGTVGVVGLVARLADRAHLVVRDLEVALAGAAVAHPWAWLAVVVLVVAGVAATWGVASRRAFVLAFLAVWLPAMAVWPYSSVRFQLPLVPLAALGVGFLAAAAVRLSRPIGVTVVAAALAVFLWSGAAQVRRDAAFEHANLAAVAADTAATATWAERHIPDGEVVASFAYRELAYRLDRPVVPLGYTSDLDELMAAADRAGARWLVVMPPLYQARGRLEEAFVAAFPERLVVVHDTPTVDTYELLAPEAGPQA